MVDHMCYLCNYETSRRSDYIKHCSSTKHIKNIEFDKKRNNDIKMIHVIQKDNQYARLTCKYCDKIYSTDSNLSRHVRTCSLKEKTEKNKKNENFLTCEYCSCACSTKKDFVLHERKCMKKRIKVLEDQVMDFNKILKNTQYRIDKLEIEAGRKYDKY